MSAGALRARRGRIGSPPRLHCPRIDGDEGARQRGGGGDREAAARCNFSTKPYLRDAAVRRAVYLAGHMSFEPANPSGSHLIGITWQLRLRSAQAGRSAIGQ
jgi:hypothetical protein